MKQCKICAAIVTHGLLLTIFVPRFIESCYTKCNSENVKITDLWGTAYHTAKVWKMEANPSEGRDLTWSFTNTSDLNKKIAINHSTGEITVTSNISIYPAYPSKTYVTTVQVYDNYDLCASTCTVSITVNFTNWEVKITSLPANMTLHEDFDEKKLLHELIVSDDNYDSEDNVTCDITNVSSNETNLFILENDKNVAKTSFKLYKLPCSNSGCGYKKFNFTCDRHIGCLNHNVTPSYNVTIKCWDAYGSSDSGVFRLDVQKNDAPIYQNLPNQINVDSEKTSAGDTLFSILYNDTEQEMLNFSYSYRAAEPPYGDPGYFIGSAIGNSSDYLANITATESFNDDPVNKTYIIEVCGHDRRNEICAELTVEILEYCGPTPNCSDDEITINDSYIGIIFKISDLVSKKDTFDELSYATVSSYMQYFSFDHTFGTVSTNGNLRASYPSSTYIITAFVYAKDACSVGNCILAVNVNFTNEPINITNLPASVSVHEDDTTATTLFVLDIQDDNEDDEITCEIVEDESVEPFYLTETIHGSEEYVVKKRAHAMLSSAKTNYSITVTCSDAYGSNDIKTLTINVELNEGPTLVDLGNASELHISPFEKSKGAILRIVTAEDKEGNDLTFNCSVQNSINPLACKQGFNKVNVTLRRDIDPVLEADKEYEIDICVSDAKHQNSSCATLKVTITTNKTAPAIVNLTTSIEVPENASVGSTLITVEIDDPDLGETHTVTVSVYPKSETSTFIIADGNVVLARPLDYETRNEYVLVFSVKDDFLEGLDERTLKLNIANVNEGNVLEVEKSSITFKETKEENTTLDDPGFTCTDEDREDTLTFSLQKTTYADYFSIDKQTGEITLLKEWDLESGLPTSTELVITCTDQGGLSSTAAVTVNIEECDEYVPLITLVEGHLDSPLQISSNSSLTATLLRFTVTDNDSNEDTRIQATIVGNGLGQKYFRIVPVNNGKLSNSELVEFLLKQKLYIDCDNNKIFSFTIVVKPVTAGGRCTTNLEASIELTVHCIADAPAIKTKEGKRCLTCTKNGKAVIACLVVEIMLLVGFIVHAACAMSCKNVVKKKKHPHLVQSEGKSQPHTKRNAFLHSNMLRLDRSFLATGSRSRPVSTKAITLSTGADVDMSSGSSCESDFDIEELRKRTKSTSSVGSQTKNKAQSSSIRSRVLSSESKERRLDHGGLPPPVFTSWISSASGRAEALESGPLPRPIYSSSVSSTPGHKIIN